MLSFTTRQLIAAVALLAVGAVCPRQVLGTDSSNLTALEAATFIGGWPRGVDGPNPS